MAIASQKHQQNPVNVLSFIKPTGFVFYEQFIFYGTRTQLTFQHPPPRSVYAIHEPHNLHNQPVPCHTVLRCTVRHFAAVSLSFQFVVLTAEFTISLSQH